jgi:hypothetical protein
VRGQDVAARRLVGDRKLRSGHFEPRQMDG